MHATLSLAAIRGAQFGIGAAFGTGAALAIVNEPKPIQAAAAIGLIAGVAAVAFTLIAETLGPTVAVGALAGFTITALTVLVITAMAVVAVTVATLVPLIFISALLESIARRR